MTSLPAIATLFIFIFAPRLTIGITVNLGAIAILFVVMAAFANGKLTAPFKSKNFNLILIILGFLAAYHALLAVLNGADPSYITSICMTACASLLFGWWFTNSFFIPKKYSSDTPIYVLKLIVTIATINSTLILISFFNLDFKIALESILLQASNTNINYGEHFFRLRGFASSGGASLSVFNAVSIAITIGLSDIKKINLRLTVVCVVIICASNIFTGRTGLIFSLILATYLFGKIIIAALAARRFLITKALSTAGLVFLLWFIFNNIEIDTEVTNWAFEWTSIFDGDGVNSSSTEELKDMLYLPNSFMDLIFGVGFFEGSDLRYPRTDSGYLKTLLSFGGPLTILIYLSPSYSLVKFSNKYAREIARIIYLIIFIILIVEIKEPFYYQNFVGRLLFALIGMFISIEINNGNSRNINSCE